MSQETRGDGRERPDHRGREPPGREAANSSIVGFIAAAGVFMLTMAFTVHYVTNAAPAGPNLESQLESRASEGLRITVGEPGFTTTGAAAWEDSPDDLDRFGLSEVDQPNVLDWAKLQELRDGEMEADDSNGEPDYPEVRDAMGLDNNTDFHLRTRPLFIPMESESFGPNPNLEVAHIAHGTSGSSNPGNATSHSITNGSDEATYEVTVENNGSEAMVYKVNFELETDDGAVLVDDEYTPLLGTGESATVDVLLREVDGWDDTTGHMNATVYDAWGNEHDSVEFNAVDLPGDPDDSTSVEHNLEVTPGQHSFGPGATPTLYLDHYDHEGDRINEQGDGPDARIAVTNPSGTEIVNESVTLDKSKALEWTCDTCNSTGDFTAHLMTPAGGRENVDHFRNASSDEFTEDKTPTSEAKAEMGMIEDMVETFENETHESPGHDGDVYVDQADVLNDHLVEHLSDYDILVVGSNVDHDELTSGGVKWPIHDWVTEEGGHLIVLGNEDPNTQWLQPLYGSGVSTASGGVSSPDPTHPLLHTPEELRYDAYEDYNRTWKLRSGADDYYTHVLQKDSSGGQIEDTLAASKPGAFGNGSVTLSAYNLTALLEPQTEEEGKKFLRNMLVQAYQMVYIDYGPKIPGDGVVASEKRAAVVPHPSLPGDQVEVKVLLYVWK